MSNLPNAESFQSQLANYVPQFTVNYWPCWLMIAGLALIAMLLLLSFHFVLRIKLNEKKTIEEGHKVYLYSKAIRLWHWSNALMFILLLFSGISNHFALFASSTTQSLVAIHKLCGLLLIAIWLSFVVINLIAGNGHHYRINWHNWLSRAMKQTHFYMFGIMRGESHPFPADEKCKFNPLQQLAYVGVMYLLLPLLLATGVVSLYPDFFAFAGDGVRYWILQIHFMLAIASVFFIFGHIYLCTTGRTVGETFRCMIDGFHRH